MNAINSYHLVSHMRVPRMNQTMIELGVNYINYDDIIFQWRWTIICQSLMHDDPSFFWFGLVKKCIFDNDKQQFNRRHILCNMPYHTFLCMLLYVHVYIFVYSHIFIWRFFITVIHNIYSQTSINESFIIREMLVPCVLNLRGLNIYMMIKYK